MNNVTETKKCHICNTPLIEFKGVWLCPTHNNVLRGKEGVRGNLGGSK